jgi:hypothetical protein
MDTINFHINEAGLPQDPQPNPIKTYQIASDSYNAMVPHQPINVPYGINTLKGGNSLSGAPYNFSSSGYQSGMLTIGAGGLTIANNFFVVCSLTFIPQIPANANIFFQMMGDPSYDSIIGDIVPVVRNISQSQVIFTLNNTNSGSFYNNRPVSILYFVC